MTMKRGLKKAAAAVCALMILSGCGAADTGGISPSSSSKTSEEAAMLVPPAMDEVFSYISVKSSDETDDDGNQYISYEGFEDSEELLGTIEEYIGILNAFGYTQSDYKESGSYLTYFLDYSDDSMTEITKRDVSCQLAIEAVSGDEYDLPRVDVYYSPDIIGEYIAAPQPKTPEEETEKATEKADSNLPPALDDVFSYIYESETNLFNDEGSEYIKYDGCENTAQVIETIESYIELLKDYGYTQTKFTGGSDSVYYTYYFDYSDDSLATLLHRGENCHLAIEAFTSDKYGWQSIKVYYSPDLMDYYRPAGSGGSGGSGGGGDDGGGSGGSGGSGSKKSGVTVPCSKCHGEKEITCTNCDGKGYKVKYVSTPNYSGHSKTSTEVRETCMKCHGTQKITCTKCDGTGVQ